MDPIGYEARAVIGSAAAPEIPEREIMGGFLKGLSVIETFDRVHETLSIAEVAKATGLDRATARQCCGPYSELAMPKWTDGGTG
jgi:hypothetical protein